MGAGAVDPNAQESTEYLARLSPAVRASIFTLELGSHIGFSFERDATTGDPGWGRVCHLETTPASPVPDTAYKTLMAMRRPTQDTFADQLTLVANYSDLRQDRMAEILAQLGTPTEFLRAISYIEPSRTPYTIELLATAHWLANFVEMRLKYALACKRPLEYSPQIQPMIWTPSHGSLPSGHATEAFTMARVLWLLLRAHGVKPYSEGVWGEMLMRQAALIPINRTVAGVHFPVDSAAGAGRALAEWIVQGEPTSDLFAVDIRPVSVHRHHGQGIDIPGRLKPWSGRCRDLGKYVTLHKFHQQDPHHPQRNFQGY